MWGMPLGSQGGSVRSCSLVTELDLMNQDVER
jgi:hypothetical protein